MDNFGKDLALLAHTKAIEEIAEIQQRMAMRRLMQEMSGVRALPQRDFYRRLLAPRQQTLAEAPALVAKEAQADESRLAKLYEIVEGLEITFARYHEASDEAWREGIADYIRQQRKRT